MIINLNPNLYKPFHPRINKNVGYDVNFNAIEYGISL